MLATIIFDAILVFIPTVVVGRICYDKGRQSGKDDAETAAYNARVAESSKPLACVHLWSKWDPVVLRGIHGSSEGQTQEFVKHDGLQRICDSCGEIERKMLERSIWQADDEPKLLDKALAQLSHVRAIDASSGRPALLPALQRLWARQEPAPTFEPCQAHRMPINPGETKEEYEQRHYRTYGCFPWTAAERNSMGLPSAQRNQLIRGFPL